MQALYIIANVFLLIAAVVLVVAVLMQDGNSQGIGAVSGGAETFFGKTKARGIDEKLKLITKDHCGCIHRAGDRNDGAVVSPFISVRETVYMRKP